VFTFFEALVVKILFVEVTPQVDWLLCSSNYYEPKIQQCGDKDPLKRSHSQDVS